MNSLFNNTFTDLKSVKLLIEKGATLFLQNDEILNMYYITAGRLRLQRYTLDGSPVILHVAFPGEIIAEASLFSKKNHCSAIADKITEVSYVKKSDLIAFLEKDPAVMRQLLTVYAHQIKSLRAINEIKNIRSATERTLAFLRNEMNSNQEVKLSISLKDVAYRIGLSHEAFYRTLKSLEKAKQISRQERFIKLL
jgi:CRP-like cAMP-binding protein